MKKTIAALTALSIAFTPLTQPFLKVQSVQAETQSYTDSVTVKLKNYLGNKTIVPVKIVGTYQIKSSNLTLSGSHSYSVKVEGSLLALYEDGIKIGSFQSFKAEPIVYGLENQININGINYLGEMTFTIESGFVRPINKLPIEDYLKGVVPYEMSDSFNIEALKTQAVAARTYALGKGTLVIDDTTTNQVYKGYDSTKVRSIQAVESTQGDVLMNNGKYVQTLYSASNGGLIFTNRNIWGSTRLPYFEVKEDPYTLRSGYHTEWNFTINKQQINTSTLNLSKPEDWWTSVQEKDSTIMTNIKNSLVRNGSIPSTSEIKIVEVPTVSFTTPPFTSEDILKGNIEIKYFEKTPNGFVKDTSGNILKKTFTINKLQDQFRPYIGSSIMKSPYIKKIVTSETSFVVTGGGWGHNVGMSQIGALEMAKDGIDYTKILNFYYPNSSLVDVIAPTISSVNLTVDNNNQLKIDYKVDENAFVEMELLNSAIKKTVQEKKSVSKGINTTLFDGSKMQEGTYQLIIRSSDSFGNTRTSNYEVKFKNNNTSPEVKDVKATVDQNNQIIYTYTLTKNSNVNISLSNGTETISVLNNSSQIVGPNTVKFDASKLKVGTYNFTIKILDQSGKTNQATGSLTLKDIVVPKFTNVTVVANKDNLVTFTYDLSKDSNVNIIFYDGTSKVPVLANKFQKAGHYVITFDGRKYAKGVHNYEMIATSTNGKIGSFNGTVQLSDVLTPEISNVSVTANENNLVTFKYTLNRDAAVSINFFDGKGKVIVISKKNQTKGIQTVTFDASKYPANVYGYDLNVLAPNNKYAYKSGVVTLKAIQKKTNDISYIVVKGDSLWKVATKFGSSIEVIKSKNKLTSNNLYVGQKLIVPGAKTTIKTIKESTYTVKSGDTLWNIAKQLGTDVNTIYTRNKLSSNQLKIGQQLIIPSK